MSDDSNQSSLGPRAASPAIPTAKGESIAPVEEVVAPQGEPGIVPMDSRALRDDHAEFGEFAHQQVREYIQLADQKAGFLFAAASVMLGYLHEQEASSLWWKSPFGWGFGGALAFVAMLGLAVAIFLAAATVYPRTPGASDGLLFWSAIARRSSAAAYLDDVRRTSKPSLTETCLRHTHELATVCAAKYRSLGRAFRAAAVGFGASVLYLLVAQAN